MNALKADTVRLYGRFNWRLVFKGALSNPAFSVVCSLRLCQVVQRQSLLWRLLVSTPAKVLHRLTCQFAGIELPWRTAIEPGLSLTHGRGIVVNVNAQVGSNVTLFHGVTLGQRDSIARDGSRTTKYPVIEDEVWIGPHAIVVGATIGKGSRIAGGAYVFEDVPPYSVVVGNPGKIVKSGCVPDVNNRWNEQTAGL